MKGKFLFALFVFCILLSITAFPQQQPYHPLRITENITLDGKLDEPAWQQTEVEDDFMQTDPLPGGEPTEKTEVRILYNNEYLFVGITCFDSNPSKMIRLKLDRDFGLGEDDGTAFIIDTYHDRTTAVNFISNTLNARWDAQVTDDGNNLNESYNTFWDAITHVDSLGYTTEYRIPFSSLRFEAKDTIVMGFRVTRLVKRKGELTTFPRLDPSIQNGWTNVSFAKDIVFYHLKSRKPFYVSPYVIANYATQNTLNSDGTAYEKSSEFLTRKHFVSNEALDKILSNIGVDAKYGLSKNFTLDLTVNTDFAQAEVDDRIINLTKYDINLPEKRSFFLESANNLGFGFPSGNEVFISRNIGNENGVVVPIIAGARMTGKSNGWQMGVLDMQTKAIEENSISPHNFFVFRTRKDIDRLGSFAGGIITNRINTDTSHLSNQSIGVDLVKRFNQQLMFEAGVASTLVNADFKPILSSTYFNAGVSQSSNDGFIYSGTLDLVGKNFNPVMGYLDESNHGLVTGSFGYHYNAKGKSKVEYWYADTYESYRWILSSGAHETFSASLIPGVTFKSGADINISVIDYKIDSLGYDLHLDDHNAIASGTYKMFNTTINMNAPTQSKYNASFTATYGGYYGGMRIFISPDVSYSFNKHLNTGITYEYNHISFSKYLNIDSNTVYISHLVRLSVAYIFSTRFSLKLYTQYDNVSHQLSNNLRFRYNPREGTDLYIVINQGLNSQRDRLDPHLPLMDSQAVTVKFVKTFGI